MCFNASLNTDIHELTLQEYKKMAESICCLDELIISGGEPSLREDLPQICNVFYEKFRVRKIRIPMNGIDVDRIVQMARDILTLCPESELFVTLPLDGIKELHDNQRGIHDAFGRLLKTYKELSHLMSTFAHLRIGFVTTVTTLNYDHIESLIKYTRNLKPQPHYHDLTVCRAQSNKVGRTLLIPHQEYKALIELKDKTQDYWIRKRYNPYLVPLVKAMYKMLNYSYLNAYRNHQVIKCKAEQIGRVIEADGNVRVCEMTEPIGNLRECDYDLNSIKVPNALKLRIKHCFCTHPCFVVPSLKYGSNIVCCLTSIIKNRLYGRVAHESRSMSHNP